MVPHSKRQSRRTRLRPETLSAEAANRLAAEGLYVFSAYQSNFATYDVCAYRRMRRTETAFGHHKPLALRRNAIKRLKPRRDCRLRTPYLTLLTGFRRGRNFGADEIGYALASAGIRFADGPGNGLLESVMIARRYGIRPLFQLPDGCSTKYYLDEEMDALSKEFGKALDFEVEFLHGLEKLTGAEYVSDGEMLWALVEDNGLDPFGLFVANYRRIPARIAKAFERETGHRFTLHEPRNDHERLVRAEFWSFVRHRYNQVQAAKAKAVRKRFPGVVISNIHFDSVVQYSEWGAVYDVPGVGIRPAISNDPNAWRHWVGYATRLIADATQKNPIVSIRTNLGAAGNRRVPTAATTKYWHSQAVRNGVRGFAFWVLDFPGDSRDPRKYHGPIPGNPDLSTRPLERWHSLLDVAEQLRQSQVFVPPMSDVAIFVNLFGSSAEHWRHAFAAYSMLEARRVYCNFVTDENILSGKSQLANFKLILIPELSVVQSSVLRAFERYVRGGGIVVAINSQHLILDHEFEGEFINSLSTGQSKRESARYVILPNHKSIKLDAMTPQYSLPSDGVDVVASYSGNGLPAIVDRSVGHGSVRVVGFDMLCDTDERHENAGRFLKEFITSCGCKDLSWVFDICVENVPEVTGKLKKPRYSLSRVSESGFPRFLYADGDS